MGALVPLSNSVVCPSGCRSDIRRRGYYYRKSDRNRVQRYLCSCGRSFSQATFDPCFGQKKRQINPMVFRLLTSLYSLRRAAVDLNVNRKTVVRKLRFLGNCAQELVPRLNIGRPPVQVLEFDDLETSEHTKCKPISVILAVESKTRWILGYALAQTPAKGLLAAIARRKYGPRRDDRRKVRQKFLKEIQSFIDPEALIKSDKNPHYRDDIKAHFPKAKHRTFKSRRGSLGGQGELKKIGHDPLFSINHTGAMFRANINRLIRRTWCTTKRQDQLDLHIALYVIRHNLSLIPKDLRTCLPALLPAFQ